MMLFDKKPFAVFGVIDLCVREEYRGKGIGGELLKVLENKAQLANIDSILLLADDPRLYLQYGFKSMDVECIWLRIDEHKNFGVGRERIENEVMFKALSPLFEARGPIDLLGYMY